MTISDDYVVWHVFNDDDDDINVKNIGYFFLGKESNEITKYSSVHRSRSFLMGVNDMEVRFANSTKSEVLVRDPKTHGL